MSTYWLYQQLQGGSNVAVDGSDPILSVTFDHRTERVYCPTSDEYLVTAEVIQKAKDLGATIIAYGYWCGVTYEAKQYGKKNGIAVMPYGGFFAYLKKHGVTLEQ